MKEQVARELRRGYENMVQQLADTTERAEQAEAKGGDAREGAGSGIRWYNLGD
jgi:hypothetical protein